MNPLVTYEAAMARIDQLHREADRVRLVRNAQASQPGPQVMSRRRTIWRRRPVVGCC